MSSGGKRTTVTLEHGLGGALSRELVEEVIYPCFRGDSYPELVDATRVELSGPVCLTTDTYTVDPPLFPGGDIGRLAVFGTCNDLAVAGARPRYLTVGLVVEEGFEVPLLERILRSLAAAAAEADVAVITGDTKVVPKGKGGGVYINTSGVGEVVASSQLSPQAIRPGDAVIVSGPIGAHGIAVMTAREHLSVGGEIRSDCAFLFPLCRSLMELGGDLRFMRDATRGGVAAVLNEAIVASKLGIEISEEAIPVADAVATVAEILGLYPLDIANEGLFVAVVAPEAGERAVELLRGHPSGSQAAVIGMVGEEHPGTVVLETEIGGRRVLGFPRGLLLPRIC